MKKYMILVLALLLILLSPTSVAYASEEGKMALQELYNDWEMNGYPDYVGHVVYDNAKGKYEIGLVNTTEAEKNQILEKIGDSDGVVLGTAKYSYNELLKVQNEISELSSRVDGIYTIAVGWTSVDGQVMGFGESGREFRVVVSLDKSIYREYAQKFQEDYGDMVYVETATMPELLADEDAAQISQPKTNTGLYITIFAIFSLAILGVFFINRGTVLVKQAAHGENITESRSLSKEEVISAVKESGVKPKDRVYKHILDKIKNS